MPQTEAPVTEDTIDDNEPVTPVVLSTDHSSTTNITFGRTEGSSVCLLLVMGCDKNTINIVDYCISGSHHTA